MMVRRYASRRCGPTRSRPAPSAAEPDARRPHRRRPHPRGRPHGRRPRPVGPPRPPPGHPACSWWSSRRRCRRPASTSRSSASGWSASRSSRLDGARPVSKDLQPRLAAFWLPSQPVLLVGSSRRARWPDGCRAIVKTVPGDRKPAWTGFWLHFLRNAADLRVWWAATDAPEEYEDALIDAFAAGVPEAERAQAARVGGSPMPWAVLRTPSGMRKPTGHHEPAAARGQGAGAAARARGSSTCRRPRRTAPATRRSGAAGRRPGRGTGRIASAAAYAAQGSPRKAAASRSSSRPRASRGSRRSSTS